MEYYSPVKMKSWLRFMDRYRTWIDIEGIVLSKTSETGKDQYHMILLICEI